MTQQQPTGVLFVCLGNICRSPLAEGVFIHLAEERGVADRFLVDSCGTGGWHVGARPDRRSIAVAERNGITLPSRARQLNPRQDFATYHWLIAMDESNLNDLLDAGAARKRVHLLRSFDPRAGKWNDLDVPDPYYGGPDGFDVVYDMVRAGCNGLLDRLTAGGRE